MTSEQQNPKPQDQQDRQDRQDQSDPQPPHQATQHQPDPHPDVDGLADKKPDELTPDELRLMADTMPGDGPGD